MEPDEALNNETENNNAVPQRRRNDGVFERKIPVAVVVLLVTQLVGIIWAASAFHANQQHLAYKFDENFLRIESAMTELEQKMYTRQEAVIQIESLRQANARQDSDIKELEQEFRGILLKMRESNAEF